ncbi:MULTISPECIES: ABC transporter ATP-binding protein [unclassified Chelatococcus]|uniref:ABC transporter ATP-binding protein n=1 Tax=unclassified Chelatococcus TaxID=2638111 RepID=UPI001BCBB7E4|nr:MULTISPECIES: ABC transporter ATP-binding protein [unclassified Chelatococcus]MBS7701398.1 ABC transporter ATP-binding protein [Chelatococcus sp. YT9]MBX3557478.1 ABC transporter ATP-binding protein [Chelatococcus sp.]
MSTTTNLLNVSDLTVAYGRVSALRSVSLSVAPGEIVAILGANGAGKTTLLNAITGVIPTQSGKVSFLGGDTTGARPWTMSRLGLSQVPEGREIFPGMTVEANLRLIDANGGGPKFTIDDVFNLFPRLRERHDQLGGALSGGEQQMLAIGRGLMAAPKILLFDEPSLGLSPMLSRVVLTAIRGLKNRGIASLLVEQNVRAALKIADRGYVLRVGRITAAGSARELTESPDVQRAYLGL